MGSSANRSAPAYAFFGRVPWGGRWSSRHHLANRLSESQPVVYLEDSVRGLGRGRAATVGRGVVSVVPRDYPLQRFRFLKRACERAASRAIGRALPRGARPLVAVLYQRAPLTVALRLKPDLVVYHALDDHSETYDGEPDEAFLAWERRVLGAAHLVVAITRPLADRLRSEGARRIAVQPLGFDEDLFRGEPPCDLSELEGLPRPLLGFAGTVRAERMDLELCLAAARGRPDLSFVFVGEEIDEGRGSLAELARLPNVRFLPFRPPAEVPSLVRAFDVAIAPYRDCRVNRRCYPLKVVEALAMGVPAVYTPARDDLDELAPHVRYAADPESFLAAVDEAVAEGRGEAAARARREAVRPLGWDRLTVRFQQAVAGALFSGP